MRQTAIYTLILLALALGAKLYLTPEWQGALGESATALVKPVLAPIVDLINAPAFVYVASLVLVVAAILACILYRRRVIVPQIRRLRALETAVRKLPVPSPRQTVPMGDAMRGLGEALKAQRLFASTWAGYQLQASREGGVSELPFSFFAASDPTVNDAERRGLMHGLPGYFTSVGLILTFVGLVVALYFAAKGFRSGNMEEARAAILQLLNASSFKFLTSVAALTGAMIVSMALRYNLSALRRETEWTIGVVDEYLASWRQSAAGRGAVADPLGEVALKLDTVAALLGALVERLGPPAERAGAIQPEMARDAAE